MLQKSTKKEFVGGPKGSENKPIKCAVCLKDFVSKVKLEEHIEAEHREETDERRQYPTTLAQEDDEGIDDTVSLEKVLIQCSLTFKCEICRIYFEHMKEL